jgi:hypothetical protein
VARSYVGASLPRSAACFPKRPPLRRFCLGQSLYRLIRGVHEPAREAKLRERQPITPRPTDMELYPPPACFPESPTRRTGPVYARGRSFRWPKDERSSLPPQYTECQWLRDTRCAQTFFLQARYFCRRKCSLVNEGSSRRILPADKAMPMIFGRRFVTRTTRSRASREWDLCCTRSSCSKCLLTNHSREPARTANFHLAIPTAQDVSGLARTLPQFRSHTLTGEAEE